MSLPAPDVAAEGAARLADPWTSHAAALANPARKGTQRWQALEAHALHTDDGLTDDELSGLTGIRLNSITTRRSELTRMGWLEDSGRTRSTEAGRQGVVWIMTPAGRQQFRTVRENGNATTDGLAVSDRSPGQPSTAVPPAPPESAGASWAGPASPSTVGPAQLSVFEAA